MSIRNVYFIIVTIFSKKREELVNLKETSHADRSAIWSSTRSSPLRSSSPVQLRGASTSSHSRKVDRPRVVSMGIQWRTIPTKVAPPQSPKYLLFSTPCLHTGIMHAASKTKHGSTCRCTRAFRPFTGAIDTSC